VTNLDDSGEGSLRDAIDQANMSKGPDIIDFQDELTGTILLTSGELLITDDVDIIGPGVFAINVSGNHQSRVFEVQGKITASISGLAISDGSATDGGGIFNDGSLTLTNVVLSGNTATGNGGAISNQGGLSIDMSTLSGNSAGNGGGIFNAGGGVTITNSTLSGNTASPTGTGGGGGIFNAGVSGTVTILNSTLSGNSVTGGTGGGIFNGGGTVNVSFATLANNSANAGGGIYSTAGTANFKNSIVANSPSGGDCAGPGTINASGVNFTTNGTCPGFTQVTSAQLNLGPLADNGGPTQTHALLPGSVAIDAAPDCTDLNGTPGKSVPKDVVETDQRGVSRPQGKACDVGSFEFVPCTTMPTITCPEDFTVSTDGDQCAATNAFTLPPADCPCSTGGGTLPPSKGVGVKRPSPKGASCPVTCAPPPASALPRGMTTVTCMVTDAFGNTAQCSFTVTVVDQTQPVVSCPANIVKSTDPDQCSAVVNYMATANDNCDGPLTPTCAPPSGSTFQKGTTTVTCMATDSSKNTGSCSFTVTVNDTQPPSLTCPANITTRTAQVGDSCVVVNYATPTASDNCPLPPNPVVCSPPSGSCFANGTTTVTCTATDSSGNIASCSFRVSVFNVCLQDDANPSTVVLVSVATGDYRFCCNGTTFTGRGKVSIRGSIYTLEHNTIDRRVLVNDDEATHRGSASLQTPVGVTRCTISDRDTRNNSCVCQ